MTLSIRDREVDRLARDLADRTGQPITQVVKTALVHYKGTLPPPTPDEKMQRIRRLLAKLDGMPVVDRRSAKEIMDDLYDESGLPK